MTISTGDILRVVATLRWEDGNLFQNVFNCAVSGVGGPWTDQDVTDDMEDWLDNMYSNIVSNVSSFVDGSQVQVYVWDPIDLDWDEVLTNSWTFAPTNVSSELPRGVAALLTARTTDPDVLGKKYFGGFTENELTTGLFSAAFLITMLSVGADWILPFVGATSGATFTGGVWSVKNLLHFAFSANISAIGIPAYQRRRKRGVGI